jgi:autotransporter-associated beta strand protein
VLRLGASNQIADYAGTLTINSDGLFDLNGNSESVNIIAGTGQIALGSAGSLTVGVNSGSSSFGGTITGTGTLIKAGSGTLALQSALILSGELQLNGGTLALSGYNLTVATLHITGNSTIDFAGGNSTLSATTFIIDAGVTLTVTNWTAAADYFFAANWSGATAGVRGSAPMNQVTFAGFTAGQTQWQSYDHQVTPVPEPATAGALLLAASGLLLAWRRRRA